MGDSLLRKKIIKFFLRKQIFYISSEKKPKIDKYLYFLDLCFEIYNNKDSFKSVDNEVINQILKEILKVIKF